MPENSDQISPETRPVHVNDERNNRRKNNILAEYAESRIRPTNQRANDDEHPSLDISQLPREQREALIEEVADSLRKILAPVTLCLTLVVIIITSVNFYARDDGIYLPYIAFYESGPISGVKKLGHAIVNSLIIIGVVVAMTMLLVLLYYCRCYKIVHGWLVIVSFLVLFLFSAGFLGQVFEAANWSFDYISFVILLYNFGILGLMSIHWKSPLKIQQFYLISISALMSLVFIKYLPEWTSWVFLVFLATYDIIAVLCPGGPLKMLINILQERNQPLMPALIYSSMAWVMSAVREKESRSDSSSTDTKEKSTSCSTVSGKPRDSTNSGTREASEDGPLPPSLDRTVSVESIQDSPNEPTPGSQIPVIVEEEEEAENQNPNHEIDDFEVAGVKLGLGDFIFYSVLIGKAAASSDWNTVYACTIGILTGLCSTLILLAVSKHALPALPISITLGVLFFFTTYYSVTPMIDELSKKYDFSIVVLLFLDDFSC